MNYSLSKQIMSTGPLKGKEVFVARPVRQKQRISFDQLCEQMAADSTIGQADIAAVFYRFRSMLNQLCSQGYIVDAGPLGTFRPSFFVKSRGDRGGFQTYGVYYSNANPFPTNVCFPPTERCLVLSRAEAEEGEKEEAGWLGKS